VLDCVVSGVVFREASPLHAPEVILLELVPRQQRAQAD